MPESLGTVASHKQKTPAHPDLRRHYDSALAPGKTVTSLMWAPAHTFSVFVCMHDTSIDGNAEHDLGT